MGVCGWGRILGTFERSIGSVNFESRRAGDLPLLPSYPLPPFLPNQTAEILRKYLGEYVKGLDKEALKISVWKGGGRVRADGRRERPPPLVLLLSPVSRRRDTAAQRPASLPPPLILTRASLMAPPLPPLIPLWLPPRCADYLPSLPSLR